MLSENTWELPFDQDAELELRTEFGNVTLLPVEPGGTPRVEMSRNSAEHVVVRVEKRGQTVRVALDPHQGFAWWGGWDTRATVYVPTNVRAHVQSNAGYIKVRDLDGCELGIKANAGKIDLRNVYGLLHVAADAGSITGRDVGGFFDVETQAGSVKLEISDLQPGDHRVRAMMGSLRLELARGLDVCIETHTNMGSVRNSYPSRKEAMARLHLSTEMGSLRVEEGSSVRSSGWRPATPPQPRQRPTRPDSPPTPQPQHTPGQPQEDPELERILKMVEAGELTAHDADELLRALGRV